MNFYWHAINFVRGIVVYPDSPSSCNPWSEPFHVEFNFGTFAFSRALNSLVEIAREGHIGLGCTRQRPGPEHSARRTCDGHSPWPDGEHARGRIHSCLVGC